jgi:trk system potassium uptake protein TrkH
LAGTGVDYPDLPCRCASHDVLSSDITEKRHVAVDFLQLQAIVIACLVVSLIVAALWLNAGMDWRQVLHHAPLLAVSAQPTTGFSSIPCEQLDPGSKLVLIFSMLVGGGTGSTAGGSNCCDSGLR